MKQLLYGPARRQRPGGDKDPTAEAAEEEQERALMSELVEGDFASDQNVVEVGPCFANASRLASAGSVRWERPSVRGLLPSSWRVVSSGPGGFRGVGVEKRWPAGQGERLA